MNERTILTGAELTDHVRAFIGNTKKIYNWANIAANIYKANKNDDMLLGFYIGYKFEELKRGLREFYPWLEFNQGELRESIGQVLKEYAEDE